ncbi:hypothetical protein E2C01_095112 [Portunus trituberculatus]|uniref:Uncharacterized protein n=1 Tax=Portunus trituberculatus TaxID=210409 RepID=A0A5B7K4X2_PORTR|nr:hypothetical protein [Portunus trituberculatus]
MSQSILDHIKTVPKCPQTIPRPSQTVPDYPSMSQSAPVPHHGILNHHKMSWHVPKYPSVSQNILACPQTISGHFKPSENVPKCPGMSLDHLRPFRTISNHPKMSRCVPEYFKTTSDHPKMSQNVPACPNSAPEGGVVPLERGREWTASREEPHAGPVVAVCVDCWCVLNIVENIVILVVRTYPPFSALQDHCTATGGGRKQGERVFFGVYWVIFGCVGM